MSQHEHEHEQEEEEALSLCDLPIMSNVENGKKEIKMEINDDEFDFNFGLIIKSSDTLEPEMCSADDVISGGQLLPFRHSVSSETGLLRTRTASWRSVSRSESMDRIGLCSRSGSGNSSRSSSIRSQSTDTSSNNSIKTFPVSKSRNNFHSHPSPKPKVWATNYPTTSPVSKKSTMWDVLSLGLVRGPGIELQDLKQRHRISTSSKNTTPFIIPRSKSSTSNRSNNNDGKLSDLLMELNKKTESKGGFFKSCKCSVSAIEPIPTREFGRNSRYFGTKLSTGPKYSTSTSSLGNYNYHILKEDKELAQKNLSVDEERKEKLKNKKKVMSHQYRTFEWLRDLSHANFLNN